MAHSSAALGRGGLGTVSTFVLRYFTMRGPKVPVKAEVLAGLTLDSQLSNPYCEGMESRIELQTMYMLRVIDASDDWPRR